MASESEAEYIDAVELVQADDAPRLWYVCACCFALVPAGLLDEHWKWHSKRGDLGE